MWKSHLILLLLLQSVSGFGQITPIPDPNFEQALIDQAFDSDLTLNGQVLTADIVSVDTLDVGWLTSISDLTGIEDFAALQYLDCSYNNLVQLDLSMNSNLRFVNCISNDLTSIDVTGCPDLEILTTVFNELTTLDLSSNTALLYLDCSDSQIDSLNLSLNLNLHQLRCDNNGMSELIIGNNPVLDTIVCYNNNLQSLDLSGATAMVELQLYNNPLVSIELNCPTTLEVFNAWWNELDSLNLSGYTNIYWLTLNESPIHYLNVKSGSNTNYLFFETQQTPNLMCIEVDDDNYSTQNWTFIDTNNFFSEDCETVSLDEMGQKDGIELQQVFNSLIFSSIVKSHEFVIFSIEGKQCQRGYLTPESPIIDLNIFHAGVYVVNLHNEGNSLSFKFLID